MTAAAGKPCRHGCLHYHAADRRPHRGRDRAAAHARPDPIGILGTIVLGIVGGFLQSLIGYHTVSVHSFHPVGIIGSIIGAWVLLRLTHAEPSRRRY
jgi:uncharacterized membrane protein YeaQ/YmgE (transglycosylase-associated protein family)